MYRYAALSLIPITFHAGPWLFPKDVALDAHRSVHGGRLRFFSAGDAFGEAAFFTGTAQPEVRARGLEGGPAACGGVVCPQHTRERRCCCESRSLDD